MSTTFIVGDVTLSLSQAQLLIDAVRRGGKVGLYRGENSDADHLVRSGLGDIVVASDPNYSAFAVNDDGRAVEAKL